MSRRSSHFFISGNNPTAKLPEYLDSMLGKMAKEMPGLAQEEETKVWILLMFLLNPHGYSLIDEC